MRAPEGGVFGMTDGVFCRRAPGTEVPASGTFTTGDGSEGLVSGELQLTTPVRMPKQRLRWRRLEITGAKLVQG